MAKMDTIVEKKTERPGEKAEHPQILALRKRLEALPPPYVKRDELVEQKRAMIGAWEKAVELHRRELAELERQIARTQAEESKIEDVRAVTQRELDKLRATIEREAEQTKEMARLQQRR